MMTRTTLVILVTSTAFLAAPLFAAAQGVTNQQIQSGQAPRGPGPGGPPRDARLPAQTGTAVVRGRVFAADTGKPLRRARIMLQAPELGGENRTTSTNAEGKFELKDLPAARYNIVVSRSGYLQLRYGQRRPFEAGKLLQVTDKQRVDNVDFALPRMSLITGRVFDETGDPISGVRVFAMRSVYFEGKRRLVPVANGPLALTDDAGQYRILGLAPGNYFVMADLRETWTVTEGDTEQVMGYAPTYFPGATGVTDARRVTVGIGQEASNTDFALIPGRAVSVSGMAVDSQGRPLVGRQMGLGQEWRGPGFGMMFQNGSGATVAADGTFTMKSVAPGPYTVSVRSAIDVNGATVQETASLPIIVSDAPIDNVMLQTSSGWSVSGQITTDTGAAPAVPNERVQIAPRAVTGGVSPLGPGPGNSDSGRVKEDWTFTVTGVFGAARLRATLPDGWAMTSILHDGRDVTDTAFELKSGEVLSGVQVVLTNRVNGIGGQVVDDKGTPLADGTIMVFATDSEKWSEDSRFVRSARPDQQGSYQIRGLPPGAYLAVAIDYVEDGMWNDPEYLESIRRYGQKVTLGEADAQTMTLKLMSPTP